MFFIIEIVINQDFLYVSSNSVPFLFLSLELKNKKLKFLDQNWIWKKLRDCKYIIWKVHNGARIEKL
jgi:hypothetical protein